jgi:hypothetical protein
MAKPRISILDRRFKYRSSADTDVGRHIRAHRRATLKAAKKESAGTSSSSVVRSIVKRSASC